MLDNLVSCGTRRESLIAMSELFDNKTSLKSMVGQNAIVDCALLLYAQNSPELMDMLSSVMNIEELLSDIQHVQKSNDLRKKKKELLR